MIESIPRHNEANDKKDTMPIIDRNSKTPIYKQIYNDINERIQKGEYVLGSMLPSENKLCSLYGVERATVRRALAMIVEDGKIARIPGLGTSVLDPAQSNQSTKARNLLFLIQKGFDDSDRIKEPFNAKLMDSVDHQCSIGGYTLLYKAFSEKDTVDDLIQTCNPCGVFYTSSLPIEMYRNLHHKGIPIVLLNQCHPIYPSVCVDNKAGAKMATEFLIESGHRHIGFISGNPAGQNQTNRFNGYKDALKINGIPLNEDLIVEGDWTIEGGKAAMRKFHTSGNLPTALFAVNDSMAIGAIMEANALGISIPGDISIVGFDNIDQSSYISPGLTTVAIDYGTVARAACMMMFNMIEYSDYELNVNIYVSLSLVKRGSTRQI